MDKFVVAVVPNEKAASELLQTMDRLDEDGRIELFATSVVTREQDGRMVTKTTDDRRGLGALAATAFGALLGLFAGPVGVGVGAAAGAAAGIASETAYSGVTGEYLQEVTQALKPGAYAIFAEVDEDWSFPLDEAAGALGGQVFRQPIGDTIKAQIKAENEAAREDMEQLDAEIARASGEAKAKLEARREAAKAAHAEHAERRRARMEQIQNDLDAKLATVQEKARRSADAAKARHEAHARKLSTFVAQEKEAFRQLFA